MTNDQAPERIWLWADVMASMEAERETAYQAMVHTYEPQSKMGIVRYVRADASPLPPPGSAAEAEMVRRMQRAHNQAMDAGLGEDRSALVGVHQLLRLRREAMLAALRAAFGESGGEGRSG